MGGGLSTTESHLDVESESREKNWMSRIAASGCNNCSIYITKLAFSLNERGWFNGRMGRCHIIFSKIVSSCRLDRGSIPRPRIINLMFLHFFQPVEGVFFCLGTNACNS
jgi:hypothetical protein